jgi:15-cis-phytoene desaturase
MDIQSTTTLSNASNTTPTTATKRVAIAGGGIAGLTAAITLLKQGYSVDVYEKRDVLGGKWSSWKDKDGDWIETGLHVFFGAYDEIFTLMREIGVYDRILWKDHVMTYTLSGGERFEFRTRKLPSPFHLLPAAFENRFFSWKEKLTLLRALYPMLFGSQKYYADQDRLTYQQWNDAAGIDRRMYRKMFMPMTLALKFVPADRISARIVLEVIGIFLRQNHASRIGLLQGSPQEHLIGPMADYVARLGGRIHAESKIERIELAPDGNSVAALHVAERGQSRRVEADYFVTALPIHNLKRLIPDEVKSQPYFDGLTKLSGVPVVTVHLWTDKQISNLDNCLFSPDGVIPVYADMANTTPEYRAKIAGNGHVPPPFTTGSRFQFVVAPAEELIGKSDEEIVAAAWASVQDVFPDTARDARIVKSAVVRVPQSVYGPYPGLDRYRVPQASPIPNLFLSGGYTIQKYYDSMEGACRSGRRAANALIARDRGLAWSPTP